MIKFLQMKKLITFMLIVTLIFFSGCSNSSSNVEKTNDVVKEDVQTEDSSSQEIQQEEVKNSVSMPPALPN